MIGSLDGATAWSVAPEDESVDPLPSTGVVWGMCMVDGAILAVPDGSSTLHLVDPTTGDVSRSWDLSDIAELERRTQTPKGSGDHRRALNGIATDGEDPGLVWVTGKQWRSAYLVRLPSD
ncbi:glutaminyl-peptide cyclotransferase [Brachybacterium sp. EF45031]|uniref:glutaminyl-peptide cyclotransferase n=1 Tax=Brachybacterium sillae TaxID=2810536 RepID=UPI00217EB6DC|nr:glutaminyl-peptide cyclotransferase [Brachybacterium sillae]MCS6712629.1 glutaminyl-peptide cyclotransferase [Brachybacterium sillae]